MKKAKPGASIACFLLAVIAAGGIAAQNVSAAEQEPPGQGFAWKDGAQVYAGICVYCHESGVGPPIRNRDLPSAYIRTVVRNGNRAMPAFRPSEIDDESLAKLADFISGSKARP
ncbi:MAG TPA: cytochrome c [Nitrosospira sp.]|nr:cytochrome c [Nitrosospira sp.]